MAQSQAQQKMDEDWRADQKLERELREMADRLYVLADRDRVRGTARANYCRQLAVSLRNLADQCVRCWD